jgi:hypothetical protein
VALLDRIGGGPAARRFSRAFQPAPIALSCLPIWNVAARSRAASQIPGER